MQGTAFGVGWRSFMYYLHWKENGTSVAMAIGLAAFAGALFGARMMCFEAPRRRKADEADGQKN